MRSVWRRARRKKRGKKRGGRKEGRRLVCSHCQLEGKYFGSLLFVVYQQSNRRPFGNAVFHRVSIFARLHVALVDGVASVRYPISDWIFHLMVLKSLKVIYILRGKKKKRLLTSDFPILLIIVLIFVLCHVGYFTDILRYLISVQPLITDADI